MRASPYPDGKLALSKKVVKKKPEEGANPYKEGRVSISSMINLRSVSIYVVATSSS